jgi:hypothetical protein
MAPPLAKLWRSLVDALTSLFTRRHAALPRLSAAPLPEPGTRDFLRHANDDAAMSDPRADAWIAHLRATLPFPQPAYGAVELPATPREVQERMSALDVEVAAQVAQATFNSEGEPDWFLTLADRFTPLASWYAGVGVDAGAPELPDRLRELTDRARRIPGINRALEWLADQVEQLTRHNAGAQAAWFMLLKVHFEAMLKPLVGPEGSVEVSFEFPAPGARVADLVPPPAPGSATSGSVARVLAPAVILKLRSGPHEHVLQRGAHVRSR